MRDNAYPLWSNTMKVRDIIKMIESDGQYPTAKLWLREPIQNPPMNTHRT